MPVISFEGKRYQLGTQASPEPLPDWLPETLPAGWVEQDLFQGVGHHWGRVYLYRDTTSVIIGCARYGDGKRWLHVSVARRNKQLPTWELYTQVKDLFIGPERTALQILAPRSKWVNQHAGCLHLYHCLDGDVTPDFTGNGETI